MYRIRPSLGNSWLNTTFRFTQGQFVNVNASFQEYALALASTLAKVGPLSWYVSGCILKCFYK